MTPHDETGQLYVYGIIAADTQLPRDLIGIDDALVDTTVSGPLAAVVSGLADEAEVGTPENLLAHSSVVDAVAADVSMLPMAFGTIVPDETELHESILDANQQQYLEDLDRIDNTVQYTVRARYLRDAVLADLVRDDPQVAQLREAIAGTTEDETRQERIQLGELVVGAFDQIRPEHAQQILDALEPHAVEIQERETGQVEDVVEVAVLVERDAVSDLDDALEDIAEALHTRINFQLLGPQAPYDFVGEG